MSRTQTLVLGLVIVLTAISAFLSGKAANDVRDAAECNEKILTQMVVALNQRTRYSDDTAAAQRQVRAGFRDLVDASLSDPVPPPREQRRIVEDLQKALHDADRLNAKAKAKRDHYPYPDIEQITHCPN